LPGFAKVEKLVQFDLILNSKTKEEIIDKLVEEKLIKLFYAKPSDYLRFLQMVTQTNVEQLCFKQYIEIKATRDLILHSDRIINTVYLSKVEEGFLRGKERETIVVDESYFKESIEVMKECLFQVIKGIGVNKVSEFIKENSTTVKPF